MLAQGQAPWAHIVFVMLQVSEACMRKGLPSFNKGPITAAGLMMNCN